jgi:hypothetical protein
VDVPRLEVLAYEHGLKPALYLTLPRAEADAFAARFADHHAARVDYLFTYDAVTDVRGRAPAAPGEGTHVDLFLSRDPALVARARAIYEDPRGPSEHLAEMGAMLGYPPCCVEAFAALPDRSNNTAIRYAALARTRRLGLPFAPVLNNLFAYVLPSFPCSYGCPRAVAQAEAVLDLLARAQPAAAATLREALARPVLFFDHARLVVLTEARQDADVLRYGGVVGGVSPTDDRAVRDGFERALGAVLSLGDGLRLTDGALEVLRSPVRAPVNPIAVVPWVFTLDAWPTHFTPNEEVASVHTFALARILSGEGRGTFRWRGHGTEFDLPCMDLDGQRIWGLTLRMVDDLVARLAR